VAGKRSIKGTRFLDQLSDQQLFKRKSALLSEVAKNQLLLTVHSSVCIEGMNFILIVIELPNGELP
jgi:hypothetical protein